MIDQGRSSLSSQEKLQTQSGPRAARMRTLGVWWAVSCGLFSACAPAVAQVSSLSLSSGTGSPGTTINLALSLGAGGTSPAGLQWTFVYPGQISAISATAGPAATAAGKTLSCASAPGLFTCLAAGLNTNAITAGVVANVQLTLATNATTASIGISNAVGVDATGSGLPSLTTAGGIVTVPAALSSITCAPKSLNGGQISTCTVTLTQTAPAGGSIVTLASNNASLTVPASVTVASGATTATFSAISAASIASNQSAIVTATLGSNSQTATVSLLAPMLVSGVACTPASLGQSAAGTCTVTLTQNAPAGGSTVTLASNNASLIVPGSVQVAAGATTATFSATSAASIASNQSAIVTATLGSSSQMAAISLLTPMLVSGVACTPASLGQNAAGTCTVTLTQTAPAGGSTVTLASNNASLTVPASVQVAAGGTTATFSATGAASIASNQNVTVTATLGSSSQTASISLLTPVPISRVGGASNNTGISSAPASLSIPYASGNRNTIVAVCALGGTSSSISSIVDSGSTWTLQAAINNGTAVRSEIWSTSAGGSVASTSFTINLSAGAPASCALEEYSGALGVGPAATNAAASGTISVGLTTPDTNDYVVAGLGANSYNSYNMTSGTIRQAGGLTTNPGSNYVEIDLCDNTAAAATSIACSSVSGSAPWAAVALALRTSVGMVPWGVSCNPASLGLGAVSSCTVTLSQTAPAGGSAVALASSNASLTMPASVTVAAGATTATFSATAAASFAGNQSATVTATLGGSSQPATISLLAQPVLVSGVTCNPTGVMSGVGTTCSITLSQPVSAGTTVSINSSSSLLSIPATVTISAGSATGNVTATAGTVFTNTQAVVTATLGASSQNATVPLWATPSPSSLTCTPTKIAVGAASSCTLLLSNVAGNLAIGLSSSNTALVAPASITVPQGSSSTSFVVTAQAAAAHSIVLTASYNGASTSQSLAISGTMQAQISGATQIQSLSCEPGRYRRTCRISLTGPSDSDFVELSLASSNPSIRLPATVAIQRGQSSVGFQIDVISPVKGRATTITAKLDSDTIQEMVSLDSRPGPLDVPGYLYAKYGTRIQFRLSPSDPGATLAASDLPAGAAFDAASGVFQWVPDVASQGTHRVVFTELSPAGSSVAASSILEVDAGTPVVTRVVNAASRSESAACSPGAVASLEGRWLAEGQATSDPAGQSTKLSGTVVRVNGIEAPILSASISRVDFLCPVALPGSTLEVALQTLSNFARPVQTVSQEITPGIFSIDESGSGQGVITHSGTATIVMTPNYRYLSRAALPGEPVTIYATGIEAAKEVSVVIGGVATTAQSIVAVPDLAGMYRVSVVVPSGTAGGETSVSLKVKQSGESIVTSNEVRVSTESVQ